MWRLSSVFTRSPRLRLAGLLLAGGVVFGSALGARALLPEWLQHAVSGSAIEAALFRAMDLPGLQVLYPRPPAESVEELNKLVDGAPGNAALLSLRALQEEAALDFTGASRDWTSYAERAPDKGAALLDLAAFQGRRLAARDQFETLVKAGTLPAGSADELAPPAAQRSWMAFGRALDIAGHQGFEAGTAKPLWQAWMNRYPQQRTVYARALTWDLNHKQTAEAQLVLERFRHAFPEDAVFPVKAAALLELAQGGPDAQSRALAVYDKNFTPLWPEDLLNSYFDLLAATHNTRRFVSDAQASLSKDPDDLQALGRLFTYNCHQSHPEAAMAVLSNYTRNKEARSPTGTNWTAEQLDTVEQLAASVQAYPEAARFAFALYHLQGNVADGRTAREAGLSAMIGLLLDAPEQPIALGAGNLSMYRDIGTLDQGPGFWNGVLSLWLNDQGVRDQFAQQEAKAQPYFHRAEAATLLTLLDTEAPGSAQRARLHAKLIEAYAGYGEDAVVLRAGEAFLQTFPHAPNRTQVALAMADADARRKDSAAEFAVYDRLLKELGEQAGNLPLSRAALMTAPSLQSPDTATPTDDPAAPADEATASPEEASVPDPSGDNPAGTPAKPDASRAFDLDTGPPAPAPSPAATEYQRVLDRYLGRLTAMKQLPQALAVLRRELDRNPNDPRLYERLATFLSQNNLSAQEEEVYRAAIARFHDGSWYDKLARFYLRDKRDSDYVKLVKQVTDIFSGTELDAYFAAVRGGGPQLAVELNLYAHRRFPHDLVFTQNLLGAYSAKATRNDAAWERLIRESWWQTPELTSEFFAWLSSTGSLEAELAALPPNSTTPSDLAATQERAEAALWASHFEDSAPLFDVLASKYPADESFGTTAADLNRSLAWIDPAGPATHVAQAVAIEQRLLSATPGDLNRLARIGDILADHADGTAASYAPASAYWNQMPGTAAGDPDAYLQAATVYWDYFQFDQALAVIREARSHFGDPVLFGYEAGAIREGKRDLPGAIHEYTRAALAGTAAIGAPTSLDLQASAVPSPVDLDPTKSPSAERLLQLATRPATAAVVDAATSAELERNGTLQALQLRVAVLQAEQRTADAAPLLLAAVHTATTADAEADLATYAVSIGNTAAHEAALAREAELTPDPTERLQLRYELVQAYQSRRDLADAQRLVDTTYRDNPLLLGVVRFTVDFDWKNQKAQQAVDVLVEAAHAAQPPLAQQFTAEAAAKANESGDPARGRSLAMDLLRAEPFNAEYVSLAAQSYAKSSDLAGLEAFYRERLELVKTAPMSVADRRTRTASLRKGLIPALTQAKDYPGAVDQYLALVSAYPEDSALIREAGLYAAQFHQQERLLAFYRQTVQASPRDARYFVALGSTEALFGDPGAALAAYTQAVALRPERSDLFVAKANLEERLGRDREAVADYERLYQLSYKDPQWMVAAAEAQARQGHTAEVVRDLEIAYLHGAQSTPHDQFVVAAQLEEWGLLPEAQHFAEQGAAAAGSDLLTGDAPRIAADDGAVLARILTRQRRTAEAFRLLRSGLVAAESSPSSLNALSAQVSSGGLASVTDVEWRKSYVQARKDRAAAQFDHALQAMGEAVAKYATPEEHVAFVAELKVQRGTADRKETLARWIPVAHAAGLGALEATWRAEVLNSAGKAGGTQLQPLVQLENARGAFAELGHTLETFLRLHPRSGLRSQAVSGGIEAFGAADETPAQLRLLRLAMANQAGEGDLQGKYVRLLARHDPSAFVSLAANKRESVADAATQAALNELPPEMALRVVAARGALLGPMWRENYTALSGLYVHGSSAVVRPAFEGALALQRTIAERLGTPADSAREFTGDAWFYLAGRYGEWLLADPAGALAADDVLDADLEKDKTAGSYLALAQTQREAGQREAALLETTHALEIEPDSATAYDARASLLLELNRRQEAVATWSRALEVLRAQQERGPAPESYWTGFERIAQRVSQYALYAQLKPAMDETVRSYLRRNGNYRSNELLQAAFGAAPTSPEGTGWVISLAGAAKSPAEVLNDLDSAFWLTPPAKQAVLEQELVLLRKKPADTATADGEPWHLSDVRSQLIRLSLEQHQGAQALQLLQSVPMATRNQVTWQEEEIVASAQTSELPALLNRFDMQPETAPGSDAVKAAATMLQRDGDFASSRVLLDWNLDHLETTHQASSSDYLAAADARLHTGDAGGAVTLLGALVAGSDDVDSDRDTAAALLEKNNRAADALPFLKPLASRVPWDLSFRVRLAEAEVASGSAAAETKELLSRVAGSPVAPYAVRVRAARDLGKAHAMTTGLGSAELNLMSNAALSASSVQQPFFVEARVSAAQASTNPRVRAELLREALGIAPYTRDAQDLRIKLFQALQQAGDEAAKAVFASTLAQDNVFVGLSSEPEVPDTAEASMDTPSTPLPHIVDAETPAQQAAFAAAVGYVYTRTGDDTLARAYLLHALDLAPSVPDSSTLKEQIVMLEMRWRLAAANAGRRPRITKELDQPGIVRARLSKAPDVLAPATEMNHE